ncbi:PREDICTED: uncharacterized protein LOC104818495 [Tarenaya hassleriana]|uniref:uncharacterized protein LOC104818495 n=1 Tax=Tarenaya hassleriana TaxID=28532 RepID=UPI00053C22D4|nr:PREDICTED: uncharacterized protein LOC104818495 [Tarenaya hassleriana]
MDLDLALRVNEPAALTDASSDDDKKNFERWDRSNRMCLMIMKRAISEIFKGSIAKGANAKTFLDAIEERFAKNEKAETSTLLAKLISMRYRGSGYVCEYIMEISDLASKLKAHKLELSDDLFVDLVLISLPTQYSQFKVSYNCQNDKWTLNELISHYVQEEDRLKNEKTQSAHFIFASKDNGKKRPKAKEAASSPQKKLQKQQQDKASTCFCVRRVDI